MFTLCLIVLTRAAQTALIDATLALPGVLLAGLALLFSARTGTSPMVTRTRLEHQNFSFRIESRLFRRRKHDSPSIRARQGGWLGYWLESLLLLHRHRRALLSQEGEDYSGAACALSNIYRTYSGAGTGRKRGWSGSPIRVPCPAMCKVAFSCS